VVSDLATLKTYFLCFWFYIEPLVVICVQALVHMLVYQLVRQLSGTLRTRVCYFFLYWCVLAVLGSLCYLPIEYHLFTTDGEKTVLHTDRVQRIDKYVYLCLFYYLKTSTISILSFEWVPWLFLVPALSGLLVPYASKVYRKRKAEELKRNILSNATIVLPQKVQELTDEATFVKQFIELTCMAVSTVSNRRAERVLSVFFEVFNTLSSSKRVGQWSAAVSYLYRIRKGDGNIYDKVVAHKKLSHKQLLETLTWFREQLSNSVDVLSALEMTRLFIIAESSDVLGAIPLDTLKSVYIISGLVTSSKIGYTLEAGGKGKTKKKVKQTFRSAMRKRRGPNSSTSERGRAFTAEMEYAKALSKLYEDGYIDSWYLSNYLDEMFGMDLDFWYHDYEDLGVMRNIDINQPVSYGQHRIVDIMFDNYDYLNQLMDEDELNYGPEFDEVTGDKWEKQDPYDDTRYRVLTYEGAKERLKYERLDRGKRRLWSGPFAYLNNAKFMRKEGAFSIAAECYPKLSLRVLPGRVSPITLEKALSQGYRTEDLVYTSPHPLPLAHIMREITQREFALSMLPTAIMDHWNRGLYKSLKHNTGPCDAFVSELLFSYNYDRLFDQDAIRGQGDFPVEMMWNKIPVTGFTADVKGRLYCANGTDPAEMQNFFIPQRQVVTDLTYQVTEDQKPPDTNGVMFDIISESRVVKESPKEKKDKAQPQRTGVPEEKPKKRSAKSKGKDHETSESEEEETPKLSILPFDQFKKSKEKQWKKLDLTAEQEKQRYIGYLQSSGLKIPKTKKQKAKSAAAKSKLKKEEEVEKEAQLDGVISIQMAANSSTTGIVSIGEWKGECKPDSSHFKAITAPESFCNFSFVSVNKKTYAIFPLHLLSSLKLNAESVITLIGKTKKVVTTVGALGLRTGNEDFTGDYMYCPVKGDLVGLVKTQQMAKLDTTKFRGQIQIRYLSPSSPSTCSMSIGHCLSKLTEKTPVSYNSENKACGAVIIDSQNHVVGIHIGTRDIHNVMMYLSEDHFMDENTTDSVF